MFLLKHIHAASIHAIAKLGGRSRTCHTIVKTEGDILPKAEDLAPLDVIANVFKAAYAVSISGGWENVCVDLFRRTSLRVLARSSRRLRNCVYSC